MATNEWAVNVKTKALTWGVEVVSKSRSRAQGEETTGPKDDLNEQEGHFPRKKSPTTLEMSYISFTEGLILS